MGTSHLYYLSFTLPCIPDVRLFKFNFSHILSPFCIPFRKNKKFAFSTSKKYFSRTFWNVNVFFLQTNSIGILAISLHERGLFKILVLKGQVGDKKKMRILMEKRVCLFAIPHSVVVVKAQFPSPCRAHQSPYPMI